MLDLRRLRTLREVVDQRSFSAAAQALDYTQSSVSEQVATLERELGVSLIERSGRPLRPTAAGEIVLAHAQELLSRAASAERELAMLARGDAGPLGLCGFFTAWATFMPAAVAAFSASHPAVKLGLHQHEPAPALSALRARDLDVAVVYRLAAEGDDDALTWTRLLDDPYAVVLPAGDPLAGHEHVALGELEQRRWVCPPADHDYTSILRGLCREHGGFEPDVGYETGDIAMVQPLVAAGLAVCVMPRLALHPRHEGVVVRPLHGAPLARSVWAVCPAQRPAPAAGAMVDALMAAARTSAAPHLG